MPSWSKQLTGSFILTKGDDLQPPRAPAPRLPSQPGQPSEDHEYDMVRHSGVNVKGNE